MKLLRDEKKIRLYEKEYESIKKKTLFKILLCVFIKTLFESFLQPLLPLYIINYYNIEVKGLGILLSFYSFSQCFMCLIIGLLSSVNKKHLLTFLLVSNLFGIYLFYLKLNFHLLVLNRIICGLSSVFIVVVNAIINELVDQKHVCRYFTYINIFNAIGIILGPLLSSLFLTIFNFRLILNFNIFGLFVSLVIVLSISTELLGEQDGRKSSIKGKINQVAKNDLRDIKEDRKKRDTYVETQNGDQESNDNINWGNISNVSNVPSVNNRESNRKSSRESSRDGNKEDNRECNRICNKENYANVQKNKSGIKESHLNNQTVKKTKTAKTKRKKKEESYLYYHEENESFLGNSSYKKTIEKYSDKNFIYATILYMKQQLHLFLLHSLSNKYKCLGALCLFRFTSAFASNLMSNIFFVFYNDNVTSDNKQVQISIFVSLSGIIMIFYQHFSFSFILKHLGYDGTAIAGLLIQSIGILLTYHSIKFYNLIFQYISICFIHSCSYAYIEPIIPTIISSFFQKKDQLFCQSIVSFFRYLSLAISPIIYSYCYIENQFFPFFISSTMSISSIFCVIMAFYFHKNMENTLEK